MPTIQELEAALMHLDCQELRLIDGEPTGASEPFLPEDLQLHSERLLFAADRLDSLPSRYWKTKPDMPFISQQIINNGGSGREHAFRQQACQKAYTNFRHTSPRAFPLPAQFLLS